MIASVVIDGGRCLAIGFGSEALVRDIVSAIFFLMDDAFRVGDHIDTGTARGVVEQR